MKTTTIELIELRAEEGMLLVGSIWIDGTTDYVLAKVQDDKCY